MPMLVDAARPAGSLARLTPPTFDLGDAAVRPWTGADAPAVERAFADPAIQRWHARTMTADEASAWVAQWPSGWRAETGASWAIADGSAVLGQIGLRRIDLAEGQAAISYWIGPEARGRRLAARALGALSAWAFAVVGLHRLELSHSTLNEASCRVAGRAGFALEGTKRSQARHADGWHDMHLHARLATD